MSGLGLVWDIAKDALITSRYAIDVTAHNIANVNTAGYSRQSAIQEAKDPMTVGGLVFGRGVETGQVARATDRFIESRLMEQRSGLLYSGEMENYVKVLEGIFNENSGTSLSALLSDYWNLWQDVSNNPTGAPERSALLEHSGMLAERFNQLDADLKQLAADLTGATATGIQKVNEITQQVAYLNNEIVGMESGKVANDLRDKRGTLLNELAAYIDVNAFEQDNGAVTVVTAKGCVLVQGNSGYDLELGGADGDRVLWQGSGGTTVDLTDYITSGKMGGWLDMRDELLAKYQLDLDELAKAFIWATNGQHVQGIGLNGFAALTAGYAAADPGVAVGDVNSGLDFYDRIVDGSFKLWLYDQNGNVVNAGGTDIVIDADVTSLNDVAAQINAIDPNLVATINNGRLEITGANSYTFAFSGDSSNAPAALGINTFFAGASAGAISVDARVEQTPDLIAAGRIYADGTFATGSNENAIAIADLQYTVMDISRWNCDRIGGNTRGTISTTVENYYHAMAGSVGITSASIAREKEFNTEMVNQLTGIRDGISAVSLDEEMANLMQFQQAYTAASKLITTADEMMQTLLDLK